MNRCTNEDFCHNCIDHEKCCMKHLQVLHHVRNGLCCAVAVLKLKDCYDELLEQHLQRIAEAVKILEGGF